MRYQNTKIIHGYDFKGIQPGQWVKLDSQDSRGQYLGTTSKGVDIIRWQNGEFRTVDAKANAPLRKFAKLYGSK